MNDFERMIRQFLAHIDVERGLSKATVSAYGADLKKYRQWLANRGINDITSVTTQDVENYVAFLDESGESARSKARRLASIHAFHRFAVDEHSVADDVSAQVKAPKGASTLPDVLAIDEVARLLEAIPVSQNRACDDASLEVSDDPVMLRDKALLEFMYATGARVSEACGANLDDVDTESRIARLMGKGSKQRLVPVGSYACEAISRYVRSGASNTGVEVKRSSGASRPVSQQARTKIVETVGLGDHQGCGGTCAHRQAVASSYVASFFRHASYPRRCRRAYRAGAAWACKRHHHADIHARQSRKPD
ncbi:tyrosine recombinase XerD [Bifidobacterium catenulatum DSM 16992 = JCM 1194 = LMG 11043]|nr:tyrosine recombinase XerD [Bifidobacterium catenulatum DSM 16992 = JCM 1194 = LMG 11043]